MNTQNIAGQDYKLPNGLDGFKRDMYVHLINWKWRHITTAPGHYEYRKRLIPYDAILPEDEALRNRMPHIYEPIVKHLREHHRQNPFRIHPHFHHMSSSQAANINLFLPILHHPNASAILAGIAGAPKDFRTLATDQFSGYGYCLEFWGGNFECAVSDKGPLGDKSAKAGTDADLAIAYRNDQGKLCLWLIEHKLTEPEFTTCGAFKSRGRQKCHDCTRSFADILKDKNTCYYHNVRKFKYWDITGANQNFFVNHNEFPQCPFQGGLGQLWRNQLLGLAMESGEGAFKHTHFSVVHHPKNNALNDSLNAYKHLIGNNPKFTSFTSADVIQSAEKHADDELKTWTAWYKDLYWI